MKTILIELPYPTIKAVDVPTAYATDFVEVEHEYEARMVQDFIAYLQRLPEIESIINADHQHVRHPLCREWVRDRLRFITPTNICHVGEALSHFLMGFRKGSGLKFKEHMPKIQALSNGTRWQLENYRYLFKTEDEAVRYMINIHVSKADFDYQTKETQ